MSFTKIKLTKGQVALEWLTEEGPKRADQHEHRFTSFEAPHPLFEAAMAAFVPHCLQLLELPADYGEGLLVSGLSVTYEEERGRGLVITLQKKLAGTPSPLIFNTPYLPEDGGEHGQSLPSELLDCLDEVVLAAGRFLQGERAQGNLFDAGKSGEAVRKAVERLRPKKGEGIESVEITSGGRGVRLTASGTERIG